MRNLNKNLIALSLFSVLSTLTSPMAQAMTRQECVDAGHGWFNNKCVLDPANAQRTKEHKAREIKEKAAKKAACKPPKRWIDEEKFAIAKPRGHPVAAHEGTR